LRFLPKKITSGGVFNMSAFKEEPLAKNVLGKPLQPCSEDPLTGFYRTGCCETGPEDLGQHTICVRVSDEFLAFSKAAGNDLITPMPQYQFPGLKAGDQWCLCALRWKEAMDGGCAPSVIMEATHSNALEVVSLESLLRHRYIAPYPQEKA
jgi:uncharacterized protein